MTRLPLRVVLHSGASPSPHLDLFIPIPGREALLTYEISSQYMDGALLMLEKIGESGVIHSVIARESLHGTTESIAGGDTDRAAVLSAAGRGSTGTGFTLALRKEDHRAVYWEYEGPITGERGSIRQIGRYWIEGDVGASRILLSNG